MDHAIKNVLEQEGWKKEVNYGGQVEYCRIDDLFLVTVDNGWELDRLNDGKRSFTVSGETAAELELALAVLDCASPLPARLVESVAQKRREAASEQEAIFRQARLLAEERHQLPLGRLTGLALEFVLADAESAVRRAGSASPLPASQAEAVARTSGTRKAAGIALIGNGLYVRTGERKTKRRAS